MTTEQKCTGAQVGVKCAYDNVVECVTVNCVQETGIKALACAHIHSTSSSTIIIAASGLGFAKDVLKIWTFD